jgi:hypothetical protein
MFGLSDRGCRGLVGAIEESAMRDIPGVSFLVITNVVVIALLIMLLSGCVVTPSRYQHPNGDFFLMSIG